MRRSGWTKWLIVIPAMLGIVLVTYVDRITDIWGFGAFYLPADCDFRIGLWYANRDVGTEQKEVLPVNTGRRHEYAQYLYEKQYQRYPAVANQMLLVMARMSILLDNYERATQELEDICIDKFNPAQLKVYYYLKVVTAMAAGDATGIQESQMCYAGIPDTKCTYPSKAELAMWIEQRAAAQMAEALKKAVPDKKRASDTDQYHYFDSCIQYLLLRIVVWYKP